MRRKHPGMFPGLIPTVAGLILSTVMSSARADYDRTRYMGPDEVRPGMRGFGRTVMKGAQIEVFQLEVIGVMRNAYYAGQDVILVRCSGLNLEHSGIIGGMSGSPCYIHDESGKDRMIGAIAYGWTFNKDPVAGVQPITQMLPIPDVRTPKNSDPSPKSPPTASGGEQRSVRSGGGTDIGELISRLATEKLDPHCRFSIFNPQIEKALAGKNPPAPRAEGLRPLLTPVMVSGMSDRGIGRLAPHFERLGLTPVASGAPSAAAMADNDSVKLEPGSALCIPFVTGDIMMEALGTCTEVDGNRVLGFGHLLEGQGSVELPLSTGMVHTVISSVMRSNKMGAALRNVGTLFGDESTGIFGLVGKAPAMVPVEVVVRDLRGEHKYNYSMVQEQFYSPMLLGTVAMESVHAHSDPPREHTIRYSIETEFQDVGTFRTTNFTSQSGAFGLAQESALPAMGLMNAPFGKARMTRAKLQVTIEEGAHLANVEEARLTRNVYKPGEKVTAVVRWQHYLGKPQYTEDSYDLQLPADLPDGDYELKVGSSISHLMALRQEKPHLFDVDTLPEMLKSFNLMASFPDNRVYLHLALPTGGMAVNDVEMPRLPAFRQQIVQASNRGNVHKFTDSLVSSYETPFAASGSQTLKFKVSRRANQ